MSQWANCEAYVKRRLNNDFDGATGDSLPDLVKDGIEKLVLIENNIVQGVSSKTQIGGVVTYSYSAKEQRDAVISDLNSYRKMAV